MVTAGVVGLGLSLNVVGLVVDGIVTGIAVKLLGGSFLGGSAAGILASVFSGIVSFHIFPYSQFVLPILSRLVLISVIGRISFLRAIAASFVAGLLSIFFILSGIFALFVVPL